MHNGRIKRKIIQAAAFGFTNLHLGNFAEGTIYTGKWKQFCSPGLNCYSCPAASFACPIGAMQAVSGSDGRVFPFYALGLVMALGVLLGRAVCGFLCPFGLIQELLNKIPVPEIKIPNGLRYLKYVLLVVTVLVLPAAIKNFAGIGDPYFCKFICPAGMAEASLPLIIANSSLRQLIGVLFEFKLLILIITLVGCMSVYRFFCKYMCPLGAIYGLLNKISLYHLEVDRGKCTGCGHCRDICRMGVDPARAPSSPECILCGECAEECPEKAIRTGFCKRSRNND